MAQGVGQTVFKIYVPDTLLVGILRNLCVQTGFDIQAKMHRKREVCVCKDSLCLKFLYSKFLNV